MKPSKSVRKDVKTKNKKNLAETSDARHRDEMFPVVGVGASAGGLEALEQFFSSMPLDIGMAFVLVPHLDPGHASMMAELLRRVTKLEVNEAQEGMKVKPNCIYVIPPNKEMWITHAEYSALSP